MGFQVRVIYREVVKKCLFNCWCKFCGTYLGSVLQFCSFELNDCLKALKHNSVSKCLITINGLFLVKPHIS